MKRQEERQENRKESTNDLVTKETICAVFALLSLLALFILCTGELVFGTIGYSVCVFLTGLFGYAAYPVCCGALYLCVTALIGKRLIKNRCAFVRIVVAVVCAALIVHTATTFSWASETYLSQCFAAGEKFPAVTVCGWVGGLLVALLSAITTKVGALVVFSALTLFFGYLAYAALTKGTKAETETNTAMPVQSTVTPVEIPLTNTPSVRPQEGTVQSNEIPFERVEPQERRPFFEEPVAQRPAFTLADTPTEQPAQGGAFSPFATPNETNERGYSYEDSRAFLFGGTPAENYQRNLIFDPNANVNKRPPVDPNENGVLQSGYTPSYTEAYQNAVNAEQPVRPMKIFSDRTERTYEPAQPIVETPVTPLQPIEPPVVEETRPQPIVETPVAEERTYTQVYEEPQEEPTRSSEGYQRHEYMDLFSSANPNVFGNSEEDRRFADETFDRTPVSAREEERADGTELPERDGLHIFDEDEPYSLRTDFEERRTDFETRDRFDDRNDDRGLSRDIEPVRDDELLAVRDDRVISDRFETPTVQKTVEPEPVKKEEPAPAPPKPRVIRPYVRVPLDDFDCRDVEPLQNPEEVEETKATILATLEDYKVTGASIASVTFGPTVTRYNVTIPRNIPPKKVVALDQPMAISLYSSGVNIYPNYEDGVVSIEVPNKQRQFVQLGCMLSGDTYVNAKSSSIMFAMGKDAGNRKVYGDISKMIHLLVAGSSGSGKSVFLGSLIISLIYKYSPEELRLILIDPKKTEFVLYNNLPHLMINEIITDANKAVQSLNWAIGEMNRRYGLFEQMSRSGTYVVNLDQYNSHLEKAERLPKIVIIIDELADLMLAAKKDIEDKIQNLTQKARAAGIHLVVATQRPSTDVITGVIKSNLPTRIAFAVATDVDSRVILDQSGAQKLLGKGDFLYTMQGVNTPVRVQSAFISSEDSQRVVNFIKANNEAYYDESATAFINNTRGSSEGGAGGSSDEIEPVYIEALHYVILCNSASISLIQRKCSIGYHKAGKIVEWMEDMGYISSFEGAKARKVLISKEEFESKYGPL